MKRLLAASTALFFLAITAGATIDDYFWMKKVKDNYNVKKTSKNTKISNAHMLQKNKLRRRPASTNSKQTQEKQVDNNCSSFELKSYSRNCR